MSPDAAARRLRSALKAPLWALSVMGSVDAGQGVLLVRVDPRYRMLSEIPSSYEGFPVRVVWRNPGIANSKLPFRA